MEPTDADAHTLLGPDTHLAIPDAVQHGTMRDLEQVMQASEAPPAASMAEVLAGPRIAEAVILDPPEEEVAAGPVPVMRGRFAVYNTPDGGYHLTYQLEGEDEPQHMEFPGMLVALAKKRGAAVGGMPGLGGFAKLFGGE